MDGAARVRWLLLGSLVLNLFFVGAAGAVALRYSSSVPLSTVARIDHSAADRLNRLAATLPMTDATVMRTELRVDAVQIAAAQADLRLSQEKFRDSLRAEPFDLGAMRVALVQVQTARDKFDLVLHNVIAAAAAKMSVVGRNKLADWPASHAKIVNRH
jgi:uncharacterized membrane protein